MDLRAVTPVAGANRLRLLAGVRKRLDSSVSDTELRLIQVAFYTGTP